MAESAQEVVQAQPAQKKGKFLLILLLTVLVIVIAGGVGYFFYGDKLLAKLHSDASAVSETKKKHEVGPIVSLEPFVFNLGGSATKYAKVSLGIEVRDPKALEETKKIVPVVRDKVLSVLSAKPAEVLMDVASREKLKNEVYLSLKGLFKEGKEGSDLMGVYITDIIIQ